MAENNGVFPELVIDMGSSGTRSSGSAKSSPLAQQVENALREVLAWRPRAGDTKGFVAALNQAFSAQEVEGRTDYTWTPRSYSVQADMGAVTGAQASIYARARAALDQSVPLLEGLTPLRPDNDEENLDAIRSIVISQFTELVSEFGQVGGPRVDRCSVYFDSLLGRETKKTGRKTVFIEPNEDDPEHVDGLFGQLRDAFSLKRKFVNTIDEEQNLTNYLIVVDHVIALRRSWQNLERFFDHTRKDVFLGTQLVLLSRALGVVAESVQQLYFVMDSVFLGAAERQTVRLNNKLTIAELFDWVERFATEEALRMIRDGGKAGVNAFQSTVEELHSLIQGALAVSTDTGKPLQSGFHHPRTQSALKEVSQHIGQVLVLTQQLDGTQSAAGLKSTPKAKTSLLTVEEIRLHDYHDASVGQSVPLDSNLVVTPPGFCVTTIRVRFSLPLDFASVTASDSLRLERVFQPDLQGIEMRGGIPRLSPVNQYTAEWRRSDSDECLPADSYRVFLDANITAASGESLEDEYRFMIVVTPSI
jgi:hypothetical protein